MMYCEIVKVCSEREICWYLDGKKWHRYQYKRMGLLKGVFIYLKKYRHRSDVSLIIGSCDNAN